MTDTARRAEVRRASASSQAGESTASTAMAAAPARGARGRTRWALAATGAAAVLALALSGCTAQSTTSSGDKAGHGGATPQPAVPQLLPAAPSGATTTTQAKATPVKDDSGIDGVLAWDTTGWPGDGSDHPGALEHDHVDGPVSYSVTPPVGGPHNGIWMNAGVYTKPIPTERAVHNLEHGAVWITYRPSLPAAQLTKLTDFVTAQKLLPEQEQGVSGQASRYIDLSPWADDSLPSPIVISSWGHQLRVDDPADPRLQQFVDTFRNSPKYTPEYGAQVDGVPVQTGGVPALDGSALPNPAGAVQGG